MLLHPKAVFPILEASSSGTLMPEHYHLALSWDWEFDRDFVAFLERRVHAEGMLFYSISHHNLDETIKALHKGSITISSFFDRASDTDEKFHALARLLRKPDVLQINPADATRHAADKATMHLEFLSSGLEVPFTIIISPYNKKREVELSLSDLAQLGRPFIIKPANTTGGGVGVIMGAETLKDVIDTRQHHKNDKYLLQEEIRPVEMNSMQAWFRVFYVFGKTIPCWWDPRTHVYSVVKGREMSLYGLSRLVEVTRKIFHVCRLDFFSTEIAITKERKFIVVDYVNETCDMRLQTRHPDGVPNTVVEIICRQIAGSLRKRLREEGSSQNRGSVC